MLRLHPACLVLLGFLTVVGPLQADMVRPGYKWVELRLYFENLSDYPDYEFFFVSRGWPYGGGQGDSRPPETPPHVVPGNYHVPWDWAARVNPEWILIAVPRHVVQQAGDKFDWKLLKAGNAGVLYSNRVKLTPPKDVSLLHPKGYELHRFRVTLKDGTLELTLGPVEDGYNRFQSWIPGLLLSGAIVAFGLWFVRWRQRRKQTSLQVS